MSQINPYRAIVVPSSRISPVNPQKERQRREQPAQQEGPHQEPDQPAEAESPGEEEGEGHLDLKA